jgi:hypothetical protein
MLAKMTSKNQITIPKKISVEHPANSFLIGNPEKFDLT